MSDSTRDRILSALARQESPDRHRVAALFVDYVFEQKLRDLIDFEEARSIAMRALTRENLDRIFERHVIPGYARYAKSAKGSSDAIGAFVPASTRDEIIKVIQKSKLPRGKWTEGAVDRVLVRRLFAPVWTNLLVSFAKRLPIPGIGGGSGAGGPGSAVGRGMSGIAGRITRSAKERAEKIVDAGKSVMGGLGTEVERRLQGAAKEFSDSAAEVFREALNDRLKSKEGRELVAQISRQVTDHVLVTTVSEIHEDAARIPIEDILRLAPSIVAHSAPRTFVQRLVSAEIDAFLTLEGARTLREVLAELGVLDQVRTATVTRVSDLMRGFLESAGFRGWLSALLDG